jgi:uncharacterized protein (TIGR00266 family)
LRETDLAPLTEEFNMQVTTRHTPSFGVARLGLGPNESVRVESGAMMAMAAGVNLVSKAEGGIFKSLKRAAMGGESFFLTTYHAPEGGGWVDVAPRLPGDLVAIPMGETGSWVISKGSWLASEASIELDAKWGGFKNLFGSEGGFVVRASGVGNLILACYGALDAWDLAAGESITVDTGHMVAYQDSVQMTLRKVTGGMVQSVKSGEGLVFDFVGPGRVYTQTRNPNELVSWIGAALGTSNSGGGAGPLGAVAGLGALGGLLSRD